MSLGVCMSPDLRLHVWVPRERMSGRQSSDAVSAYRLPARILSTHATQMDVHIFYKLQQFSSGLTDALAYCSYSHQTSASIFSSIMASETTMPVRTFKKTRTDNE